MKPALLLFAVVPSIAVAAPSPTAPQTAPVDPESGILADPEDDGGGRGTPKLSPTVDTNVIAPIDSQLKLNAPIACLKPGAAIIGEKGSTEVIGEKGSAAVIGEKIIGEKGSAAIIGEKGSGEIIGEKGSGEVSGVKSAAAKC